MKKILSIFAIIFLTANVLMAASPNNEFFVRGHVIDVENDQHIAYATISAVGTTFGCATDESGHFYLAGLPAGEYTLRASMVGYTPVDKDVVIGKGDGSADLTFELAPDVMQLSQVVVSASRSAVTRRESPSMVNVMGAKLFEKVNAPSLADGLSFQPGVRVENNCQNCGFTQVRINGLDGHYSQILIDSKPMFSALTGVYGLEQIPANMVERVEVVRGGGSALFGSSAIGGTINVITKSPSYNTGSIDHTTSVIGGDGAMDNATRANLSLVTNNQRAGVTLFGQVRSRDSYDANGDGFSESPLLNSTTFGLRTFFKTGQYSKLSIQYDALRDFRRGGNQFDLPAHISEVTEQVAHTINGGGVTFDLLSRNYNRKLSVFSSIQDTHRDSFYGTHETPEAYGNTDELIWVSGAQFTNSWDKLWFMPAEFVAGVEYNYNDLVDQSKGLDYKLQQEIHTVSAYAQNEWRTSKFGVLVGVRADKNSLLDNVVFSPRLNLRYNPSESVNFRATYSTGFRAPQAFDEDLHIAVVGGERVVTRLADDLKQESSQSLSLSADLYHNFGDVMANLMVEGFYTKLDDAYTIRQLGEVDGVMVQERYNGSGTKVGGVSAEMKLSLPQKVDFQLGMTYQQSRFNEAEQWSDDENVAPEKRLFRTPDLYGYFMTSYRPVKPFEISASATYTGKMLVPHMAGSGVAADVAVETPSFFDLNLRLGYTFQLFGAIEMEVYGGVQNILNSYQSDFDKGFDRDPGYIYGPMLPRRFNFGAKISF